MSFTFKNDGNWPINVSVRNGGVIHFQKDSLKPGESWSCQPGAIWFDVYVEHSTGKATDIAAHNFGQVAMIALTVAGGIVALAAVPASGGLSVALYVTGIAIATGSAGVGLIMGALNRARLEALYGGDSYEVSVTGGLKGQVWRNPDTGEEYIDEDYEWHQMTLHWTNLRTNAQGRSVSSESLGGGWTSVPAMATLDDHIYSFQGGKLWKTDANGHATDLGGGWTSVGAMTAMNGNLYAFQGGKLWRVDTNGRSTDLGGGWILPGPMTAMNGNLYALQGGKLWRVDADGRSTDLGNRGSREAMVAMNGFLYTVVNGILDKYDANGQLVERLEVNPELKGALSATTLGNHLYIIANETLWRIDENGQRQNYGSRWGQTGAMTGMGDFLYVAQGGNLWKVRVLVPSDTFLTASSSNSLTPILHVMMN